MPNINKDKLRIVVVPIQTYRSVKRTAAEIDRPICDLLADAWNNYTCEGKKNEQEELLAGNIINE